MKKIVVFDLPTRIFHWVFALGTVSAYSIAQWVDKKSAFFAYHSLIGMVVGAALVLRILWGVVGSRYARFSSFTFSFSALAAYLKNIGTPSASPYVARNPAASWASVIMYLFIAGLVATGVCMLLGVEKETLEEVHEVGANLFVLLIIAHIAGLVVHQMTYKDHAALGMIHGRRLGEEAAGIKNTHTAVGMVYLAVLLLWATYLVVHYDVRQRMLILFGTPLQIGELELIPYKGLSEEELMERKVHVDEAVLRKRREDMLDNIERRKKLRAEERERALEGQQR